MNMQTLDRPPAPRDSLAPPPAPMAARPRPPRDMEELLGGTGLAWLGGVTVLVGLAFLLTMAVSRGWLGEGARTALAGGVSLALLGLGVRLRERRRNEAALAAAAVGVAGGFGTLVVAGQVYSLIPGALSFAGALAVGAAATALAVRWRAPLMGWLGLCGALLAPAVVGGDGAIAYLAVAYAATVGVLVWQRWTWLGLAAVGIATWQWVAWLISHELPLSTSLATLVVFGLLTMAAAAGFEVRRRQPRVRISAAGLLVLNALVLDIAGWWMMYPNTVAEDLWVVGVAVVHLLIGLAGRRIPRVSHELSLIALGLGVMLADVAFASLVQGLPLVLGWVAGTIGFGWLLRRHPAGDLRRVLSDRPAQDRAFAIAGLGSHLLYALAHAFVVDAPLAAHGDGATGILAMAAVAAGAAISARLAAGRQPWLRVVLDTIALAVLYCLTLEAAHGLALPVALAGQAAALAAVARRERDELAGYAALAFAGTSLAVAVGGFAPPAALVDGLAHPLWAAAALAAAAGALALTARAFAATAGRLPRGLQVASAAAAFYGLSVEAVAVDPALTGQTLLSVLWGVTGVGLLVTGLVRDRRTLRRVALGLLAVTAAKVFLYDLAALDSMARVGSLIGLGVLLLAGGFAWQRVRPLPLPDLREAEAH
jgi:uncharacterized membrane protein